MSAYYHSLYSRQALLTGNVSSHRRKPHGEVRTAQEMLKANPYTPTAALYRSWLAHSPRLAELSEVQKWLESTYRPPEPPLLTKEYWKFTRMDLKQKKRQGQTTRTGYVRTLDPDATNRTGDSGVLNADDAEEEKALINALFHYVRAGRIEEAAAICEKAARPWRAAFLQGVYHLHWPGLEALNEPPTELKVDEARWTGNRRWLLWRQTCGRAALSVSCV
jgi:nuclear pore complex protein Nup107